MANEKDTIVLSPDAKGKFTLPCAKSEIQHVDISDIDIIITTKTGTHYLLPGAGLAAMGDHPPDVGFSNSTVSADQLLGEVGTTVNMAIDAPMLSSLKAQGADVGGAAQNTANGTTDSDNQNQQSQSAASKTPSPEESQLQANHDVQVSALTVSTEASVEQLVQNAQKIEENLHTSDYAYVPPHTYEPPPSPAPSPPGVTPPINVEPIVTLFMGNVVGTTTTTSNGVTYIYGGGGAVGTDSSAQLGPRDALQFSPATITGTSGNDVIYADGPLVGNTDPTTDRSMNAKQFTIGVAGYFTALNDVTISGLPTGVSIGGGATQNQDGSWTLPSSFVTGDLPFTIVYDQNTVRGTGSFDLSIEVSGTTTRHNTFSETQTFRLEFLDVTSTSQITDPTLVYDAEGYSKEIYILPTQGQPAIINSGDGNDVIYGDINNDQITAGNGNDQIFASGGNDTIVTGDGNSSIDLGSGNSTLTVGNGSNTVIGTDGNNTITAGNGGNTITLGNGANVISVGSGNDTVTLGNGNNTITDTGGTNSFTTGSGNDHITAAGAGTINAGSGNNTIAITSGSGSTNSYSITTTGSGTNTITGGDDLYTINMGSGTNTVTLGSGTDGFNTQITTGAGNNTITTGAGEHTISVGTGNATITTGAGADTITTAGGGGVINAGAGSNAITVNSTSGSTDSYTLIASGTGAQTITGGDDNYNVGLGDGTNNVTLGNGTINLSAGNGANTLVLGNGPVTVTTGSGNDTITTAGGGGTINAGTGDNSITVNSTNGSTNNYLIVAATRADTVTLNLAEDAYQGDAQFTFTIDGKQIGGIQTVTALHMSGQNEAFTITGYFDAGAHTVGINFLNDAYGGSSTTDRNLYVNSIVWDGSTTTLNNEQGGSGNVNYSILSPYTTNLSGNNNLTGGDGNYTVTFGDGNNTVQLGTGNDVIHLGTGTNNLTIAGNGSSFVNTGNGTNAVTVGGGNNILTGGSGNDTFTAGNGTNTIKLGLGVNLFTGGTGSNTLDLSDTNTSVVANLANGTANGAGITDTFTGVDNIIGNNAGDIINGNAHTDVITGGAGVDTITSGNGTDTIYGLGGDDIIHGGTGNDTIFGGDGNNTIYSGTAGNDYLYGGSGNNTFISQHAGVHYDGTNGGSIGGSQVNTIDYSADTTGITVNLLQGVGTGGLANGDTYAFTPTSGVSTINKIIGGSGYNYITDSNGNDTIVGGTNGATITVWNGTDVIYGGTGGNNTFYDDGSGTKTYYAGPYANWYEMGPAAEHVIIASPNYNQLQYDQSPSGVLINLTSTTHSVINSNGVTINVNADSGAGWGTASDTGSYAIGDTYTHNAVNYMWLSSSNDVVWGGDNGMTFDGNNGTDYFFGGAGNDFVNMTDSDRLNGGGGTNTFYTNASSNVTVYLDGSVDLNSNGIADSIDYGHSSLTIAAGQSPTGAALTYTGFATGWYGTGDTFLTNFQNILGSTGNDTLVGDANANILNGQGGTNSLYGEGGNDTLYATIGTNHIDGGTGVNTVAFDNNFTSSSTTPAEVFLSDGSFYGASDQTYFWGSGFSAFQARTGANPNYSYDTIVNVQNINGSEYNDVLYGNSSANVINGNGGDDIIAGMGGADSLYGGAGNDTFLATLAQYQAATVYDGGTGTDTLKITGYTSFAAGSFAAGKTNSIEIVDVRNSASGNSYSMNANDVQHIANNGTSSSVTLMLDTGDTFTANIAAGSGALSTSSSTSGADTIYTYFANANHTGAVATLDVHYG